MRYHEIEKLVMEVGYTHLRTRGTHKMYGRGSDTIVIPASDYDMGKGLAKKILKDAGYPHPVPQVRYFPKCQK